MMGMGTPAASPATAAFWQQARQLPHMNTFQANSAGMGHNLHGSSVPHQYGHTHHTSQPHDAKMAEKIWNITELRNSAFDHFPLLCICFTCCLCSSKPFFSRLYWLD